VILEEEEEEEDRRHHGMAGSAGCSKSFLKKNRKYLLTFCFGCCIFLVFLFALSVSLSLLGSR
jgi:hypothetical protein